MRAARSVVLTRFVAAALLAALGALVGCAQGKRPFLMVQLCFRDDQELADFTHLLESVAYSERMTYIDGSGPTESDLETLNPPGKLAPAINISLESTDGFAYLAVANLGLPKYQVAVGFSDAGSKVVDARRFADTVVSQLRARWHVETVPEGRGALPIPNCLTHSGT